jgi:ATP-dependent DNA ligase
MPLAVMPQAWDQPDWLWELKYDGFRSLACVEAGACRLVSRKHADYKAFKALEAAILATFDHDVVLDSTCCTSTAATWGAGRSSNASASSGLSSRRSRAASCTPITWPSRG